MKNGETKNVFHDINRLPTTEGIISLGISMSRIGNAQSPKKCFEYLKHFASKIQYTEGIAMEIWYGDYLYFHSTEPAYKLRDKFSALMISHKNGFMHLLKKDRQWTHKAFSFKTFGQIILDNSEIFVSTCRVVASMYKSDKQFAQYVDVDCASFGRGTGRMELNFILEEVAIFYLLLNGKLLLNNKFVTDSDKKWTLKAYPGKPLRSEIYLIQKNPMGFSNPENKYENCFYDLEAQKLYDYTKLDIDTFKF
jgi:hypothetical protein